MPKYRKSTIVTGLIGLMVVSAPVLPVWADDFEWTNASNGSFATAGNWTLLAGAGPAPPGIGDLAWFNNPGDGSRYTVVLVGNNYSDELRLTNGVDVVLEGDTGVNYYLTTGAADMTIGGGALVWVGSADPFDDPLNMVIGDALGINGGHMIIIAGSNVYAWSLSVGVIGGGSLDINDGSLTITGTGPHSLGVFGNADLEIWEDSFLTINGPVYLGVSSSISTSR